MLQFPASLQSSRVVASLRVITALMLREMSTRYGRSPGGYIWALLEPLGGVTILAIGFSLLVRHPPLGTSFMLFYATGYLPFELFQRISQSTAKALRFSRPFLSYPAVSWIDAVLARFFLNSLTSVTVAYILLTGIMMFSDTHTVIDIWPIVIAMSLAALLGLAVGSVNAVLGGFFETWESIWAIVTRPLFLASGVLLLYENLPGIARDILWFNPLLHITGEMRSGFYPMYEAAYVSLAFVLLTAMCLLSLGMLLLHRYHRKILNL